MKRDSLTPADVLGRWVFYRRAYGWHRAELRRAFIQDDFPESILGIIHDTHPRAHVYPARPERCPCPLLLPLDELEIHAIVEPVATEEGKK